MTKKRTTKQPAADSKVETLTSALARMPPVLTVTSAAAVEGPTLGAVLREWRTGNGIAWDNLPVDVTPSTWRRWESNVVTPSADHIAGLAEALDVTPHVIAVLAGATPPGDDTVTEAIATSRTALIAAQRSRMLEVVEAADAAVTASHGAVAAAAGALNLAREARDDATHAANLARQALVELDT